MPWPGEANHTREVIPQCPTESTVAVAAGGLQFPSIDTEQEAQAALAELRARLAEVKAREPVVPEPAATAGPRALDPPPAAHRCIQHPHPAYSTITV
jgi:hypothetical protein